MRFDYSNDVELEIFCDHINKIIDEAITHGGDTGGAYCINQEELLKSIYHFIRWLGLEKDITIYNADRPKLLLTSKIKQK